MSQEIQLYKQKAASRCQKVTKSNHSQETPIVKPAQKEPYLHQYVFQMPPKPQIYLVKVFH